MRLINLNKAFKAGPARTAVFLREGGWWIQKRREAVRRRWGEGRELVRPEDVSMLVLMILAVTRMLGLTDFF